MVMGVWFFLLIAILCTGLFFAIYVHAMGKQPETPPPRPGSPDEHGPAGP